MTEAEELLAPALQNGVTASPWELRRELHSLAAQIVRASGHGYPAVQNRLNQAMHVRQRDQADPQQLHEGIEYAHHWLRQLDQAAQPPSETEHDRWRRELRQWAAARGLTLTQVAELAQSDRQAPPAQDGQ